MQIPPLTDRRRESESLNQSLEHAGRLVRAWPCRKNGSARIEHPSAGAERRERELREHVPRVARALGDPDRRAGQALSDVDRGLPDEAADPAGNRAPGQELGRQYAGTPPRASLAEAELAPEATDELRADVDCAAQEAADPSEQTLVERH
ncbi:MAG: hypothetical protein V3T07_09700 [Myxococcota bacterium]